jgi:Bacterial SH3 domain
MTLTADQYFQIAQGYAKAAADPFVSPERREALANKAEWFDFLGRRRRGASSSDADAYGNSDLSARRLAPPMSYSGFPEQPLRQVVTTRWLTGAALCLIAMLVLTSALNPFGGNDRSEVASPPKIASIDGKPTQESGQPPIAARPESLPDQPHEASALTVRPAVVQQEEFSAPSPPPEPIEGPTEAQSAEVLKVTKHATLRNRPSTRASKIGTATPGTAIHVKARERDWVQFVDPSSGQTGWIHASLVRPAWGSGAAAVAATQADTLAPSKPKVAKKQIKQKPSAPLQASKQRPLRREPPGPGQRAYADVGDDDEFLALRSPSSGLLRKRRMLREGLMSSGFLPPQ